MAKRFRARDTSPLFLRALFLSRCWRLEHRITRTNLSDSATRTTRHGLEIVNLVRNHLRRQSSVGPVIADEVRATLCTRWRVMDQMFISFSHTFTSRAAPLDDLTADRNELPPYFRRLAYSEAPLVSSHQKSSDPAVTFWRFIQAAECQIINSKSHWLCRLRYSVLYY